MVLMLKERQGDRWRRKMKFIQDPSCGHQHGGEVMKISEAGGEGKVTKLDVLLQEGDSSARPHTVLTGHNLGSNTLTLCVPIHQFWEISEDANERNISEQQGLAQQPVAQQRLA